MSAFLKPIRIYSDVVVGSQQDSVDEGKRYGFLPFDIAALLLQQMGNKKDEDWCNFSRKDLQGLCKKYGLPANKTSSEMSTSLILYLERRNLTSQTICKGTKSDHYASSSVSELLSGGRINSVDEGRKECYGNNSGNGRCSSPQEMQQIALQNFTAGVASNKACRSVQNLPQLRRRDSNGSACLPENVASSVVNSSTEVSSPTFQFNVSCEDGIELFVDLNSSSSEWVRSMKSAVHICHDVCNKRSQSYNEEFEGTCCPWQKKGSFLQNIDSDLEINNSQEEDRSYPTSVTKKGGQEPTESNGDGSLSVSALVQSINNANGLEHAQGDQVVLPCRHESHVEKQNVCCTNYCGGDGETMPTGLDLIEATQIQSPGNFVVKTSLHGVKCFGISENETLKPAIQIWQNSSLQQTLSPLNPIAEVVKHSATLSLEVQECSIAPERGGTQNDISVDLIEQTRNVAMEKVGAIDAVPFNQGARAIPSLDVSVQRNGESCFPCFYSGSDHLIDPKHSLDRECGVLTTLRECNHGPVVAGKLGKPDHEPVSVGVPLMSLHWKEPPSSPSTKDGSLDLDETMHTSETEMDGLVSSNEFGQKAIEMKASMSANQRRELLFSDCAHLGHSDMLVLKQKSEVDNNLLIYPSKFNEDICKNQTIAFTEKLESGRTANGRENSECLYVRDTMEKTCSSFDDSQSDGVFKRKRHSNNEDHHKADAKVLRSPSQFSGEIHTSRRSVWLYSK